MWRMLDILGRGRKARDESYHESNGTAGLPKQEGQSLSYWLQGVRCDPLLDHRSTTKLPEEADTVVIGSGISGTLVASKHLEAWPERTVVVLEAREFCSGATGRNAGHCKPDQWRGFAKYEKAFGAEQALKILGNEQETWSALVQYVHENNVDCDLWVGDTLDVAMTAEVAAVAKDTFERLQAASGRVDHIKVTLDPEEARKITRLKGALACYAWPASTLQPWKLAAHIMRTALDSHGPQLNLQTYTPATSVIPSPSEPEKWFVETSRGTITATNVVFASNAYTPAILPVMGGLIKPTPHMCNKVVPPRTFNGSGALQNSYGVLLPDGALFSINPRCTTDGIVMFGGSNPGQRKLDEWLAAHPEAHTNDGLGTGSGHAAVESVTSAVKHFAESQFVGWEEGVQKSGPGQGYDYQWSGIIGRSADGVPFIGAVPGAPGQWVIAGHHGHGMARIFTAAPGLVKLMTGAEWKDTGLPDVYQITEERIERLRRAAETGKGKKLAIV